jgi:dihydroorotase
MIDPHVHLRDWNQSSKETIKHGLLVAYKAGLDAVFEMPNTDPSLISLELIKKRIQLADKSIQELKINIFHGIYVGITDDINQIKEMVNAYNTLFPRVIGFKMFAGRSTGNLGLLKEEKQKLIYSTLAKLNYKGVIAVHCEKESYFKSNLWNYNKPITHCFARPPISEVKSVKDQIQFAHEEGFKGTMHIVHISVPETLSLIESKRKEVKFKITCGITPHHALLYDEMMNEKDGILLKVNPPLRSRQMQKEMFQALIDGRIDFIETDHAPHTLIDKKEKHASGFAGLAFYPRFINFLKNKNLSSEFINQITHLNIEKTFEIKIEQNKDNKKYDKEIINSLINEYEFNAYKNLKI